MHVGESLEELPYFYARALFGKQTALSFAYWEQMAVLVVDFGASSAKF